MHEFLFAGAGGAVFYPIGFAILDPLFQDRQTLIGLWTACFAIGPALGYVIEGLFLTVDSNHLHQQQFLQEKRNDELNQEDFSSAWWIGN